jgi:hypothetical protein
VHPGGVAQLTSTGVPLGGVMMTVWACSAVQDASRATSVSRNLIRILLNEQTSPYCITLSFIGALTTTGSLMEFGALVWDGSLQDNGVSAGAARS